MRLARIAGVLTVLGLTVPATAGAALPRGDWVGKSGTTAFGVVVGSQGVLAYTCDGERFGKWFSGSAPQGRKITLRKAGERLRLRREAGELTATFRGSTTSLAKARRKAGLYRSENRRGRKEKLGGWIVLRNGKIVGGISSGGDFASGPQLSTTTMLAGSLTAAQVISPADPGPIVVDLDDDGLNVDSTTTTSTLTGSARQVRWTQAGDDDAFIGVNATALKAAGFTLSGAASSGGAVVIRGGLRVTRGSLTTTAVDGFHVLRLLDTNGDGRLSGLDSTWGAMRLLRDATANGSFGDSPGLAGGDMVAEMAEMNMQFLALQEATQAESRKFQTLSNASRARSEVILNAINALKG